MSGQTHELGQKKKRPAKQTLTRRVRFYDVKRHGCPTLTSPHKPRNQQTTNQSPTQTTTAPPPPSTPRPPHRQHQRAPKPSAKCAHHCRSILTHTAHRKVAMSHSQTSRQKHRRENQSARWKTGMHGAPKDKRNGNTTGGWRTRANVVVRSSG